MKCLLVWLWYPFFYTGNSGRKLQVTVLTTIRWVIFNAIVLNGDDTVSILNVGDEATQITSVGGEAIGNACIRATDIPSSIEPPTYS